jgi:hypothetical protein
MTEHVALPKTLLYLYGFVLVLAAVYFLYLIGQAVVADQAGGVRKPCHGCSDADLGLVIDPEPSQAPKKGA